jgi:nucleotide-binding universal stress UspA family protein
MECSMIVMGHRHLSRFDRMLHPSICWDVLEHADCPVLVSMAEDRSGARETGIAGG